ncbi:MAG: DUF1553 domain-containing protein [Planctomycetaceae bacterium]|nr:DUF1553 domain-containing protein [Planctomycetaceae bacterium]
MFDRPRLLANLGRVCVWLVGFFLLHFMFCSQVAAQDAIQYSKHIRPILADKCFACHGPDAKTRAADLRLDQFEAAVDGGAIVVGDPDSSEMIARINLNASDEGLMPPVSSHKSLTADERSLLARWIQQGAKYESHWAFIAPVKPMVPAVQNAEWVTNDIDRFVLAKLESMGLQPNGPADPAVLARRLALDTTGLPPKPEDVQAFVSNPTLAEYEALVDKYLASPAWGEHRARYWLDLARYADTHGIHFDNYREIWAYRDWVIDAFNRNQPFDEFTVEQLAGDLLPNPTLDQQIATGFSRCNITTNEGGVIEEEYRVLYFIDRTETLAQTWMGLTVGCAVCHDHKFDPVSQVDFYQMAAFFNNTTQPVMDGNIPNTPPIIFVPAKSERERWNKLNEELTETRQKLDSRRGEVSAMLDQWLRQPTAVEKLVGEGQSPHEQDLQFRVPTGPTQVQIPWSSARGGNVSGPLSNAVDPGFPWAIRAENFAANETPRLPGVGDIDGDQPFSLAAWVRFQGNNNSGALLAKMSDGGGFRGWDLWSEGGRIGMHLINEWPSNALKVVTSQPLPSDQWHHVVVTYDGSRKAAGLKIYIGGNLVATNVQSDNLSGTIRNDLDLILFQRHGGRILEKLALDDVRLYARQIDTDAISDLAQQKQLDALRAGLQHPENADQPPLTGELRELALNRYLSRLDTEHQQLKSKVSELETEAAQIRQRGTLAHVMQERTDQSPTAFVLHRGQYDQRRDQVSANTPGLLPAMSDQLPKNRLGLAKWLVSPEHPLTARVTVNQFWQAVFGQGLVATSGDFGLTGVLPTHPELLDYLAIKFREDGWNIKAFYKQMLLSSTYRQSSQVSDEKLNLDPDNIWLSRGPRFRMDAEMVRDYALAASGILVPEIGGPSVRPYQPPGVWEAVAMIGSNTRDYVEDRGSGLYRRSMYTLWKRSAPPASMDVFNAPSREACTVRRERTNTPLQALALLNDPQLIEAARFLAIQVMQLEEQKVSIAEPVPVGATLLDRQLALASWRILCRDLKPAEQEIILKSWEHLRQYYDSNPDAAAALNSVGYSRAPTELDAEDLAAWTMLLNQLFNLDEVINK